MVIRVQQAQRPHQQMQARAPEPEELPKSITDVLEALEAHAQEGAPGGNAGISDTAMNALLDEVLHGKTELAIDVLVQLASSSEPEDRTALKAQAALRDFYAQPNGDGDHGADQRSSEIRHGLRLASQNMCRTVLSQAATHGVEPLPLSLTVAYLGGRCPEPPVEPHLKDLVRNHVQQASPGLSGDCLNPVRYTDERELMGAARDLSNLAVHKESLDMCMGQPEGSEKAQRQKALFFDHLATLQTAVSKEGVVCQAAWIGTGSEKSPHWMPLILYKTWEGIEYHVVDSNVGAPSSKTTQDAVKKLIEAAGIHPDQIRIHSSDMQGNGQAGNGCGPLGHMLFKAIDKDLAPGADLARGLASVSGAIKKHVDGWKAMHQDQKDAAMLATRAELLEGSRPAANDEIEDFDIGQIARGGEVLEGQIEGGGYAGGGGAALHPIGHVAAQPAPDALGEPADAFENEVEDDIDPIEGDGVVVEDQIEGDHGEEGARVPDEAGEPLIHQPAGQPAPGAAQVGEQDPEPGEVGAEEEPGAPGWQEDNGGVDAAEPGAAQVGEQDLGLDEVEAEDDGQPGAPPRRDAGAGQVAGDPAVPQDPAQLQALQPVPAAQDEPAVAFAGGDAAEPGAPQIDEQNLGQGVVEAEDEAAPGAPPRGDDGAGQAAGDPAVPQDPAQPQALQPVPAAQAEPAVALAGGDAAQPGAAQIGEQNLGLGVGEAEDDAAPGEAPRGDDGAGQAAGDAVVPQDLVQPQALQAELDMLQDDGIQPKVQQNDPGAPAGIEERENNGELQLAADPMVQPDRVPPEVPPAELGVQVEPAIVPEAGAGVPQSIKADQPAADIAQEQPVPQREDGLPPPLPSQIPARKPEGIALSAEPQPKLPQQQDIADLAKSVGLRMESEKPHTAFAELALGLNGSKLANIPGNSRKFDQLAKAGAVLTKVTLDMLPLATTAQSASSVASDLAKKWFSRVPELRNGLGNLETYLLGDSVLETASKKIDRQLGDIVTLALAAGGDPRTDGQLKALEKLKQTAAHMSTQLNSLLSSADRAIGEIDALQRGFKPERALLSRPSMNSQDLHIDLAQLHTELLLLRGKLTGEGSPVLKLTAFAAQAQAHPGAVAGLLQGQLAPPRVAPEPPLAADPAQVEVALPREAQQVVKDMGFGRAQGPRGRVDHESHFDRLMLAGQIAQPSGQKGQVSEARAKLTPLEIITPILQEHVSQPSISMLHELIQLDNLMNTMRTTTPASLLFSGSRDYNTVLRTQTLGGLVGMQLLSQSVPTIKEIRKYAMDETESGLAQFKGAANDLLSVQRRIDGLRDAIQVLDDILSEPKLGVVGAMQERMRAEKSIQNPALQADARKLRDQLVLTVAALAHPGGIVQQSIKLAEVVQKYPAQTAAAIRAQLQPPPEQPAPAEVQEEVRPPPMLSQALREAANPAEA